MTKPPKYYNQVRIPAGSPTDGIRLTKSMSQQQMCDELRNTSEWDKGGDYICDYELKCERCMFDSCNIHHWKQWKKETFKGVKRCKKIKQEQK